MTRAVPLDLGSIPESEGAALANACLRLVRWSPTGPEWTLTPAAQEARDRDAINLFGAERARTLLSQALVRAQVRSEHHLDALQQMGWHVASIRVMCVSPVLPDAPYPSLQQLGLTLHRTTGIPFMPSVFVRTLARYGAVVSGAHAWSEEIAHDERQQKTLLQQMYGTQGEGTVMFFDALPVELPTMMRRPMDPRWTLPPAAGQEPQNAAPSLDALVLCTSTNTEIQFWFAARDLHHLSLAQHHLELGMNVLGLDGTVLVSEEEYLYEEPAAEEAQYAEEGQAYYETEEYEAPEERQPQHVAEPTRQPEAEPQAAEAEESGEGPDDPNAGPVYPVSDEPTITVHVPTVQYLPNNGRVVVMFLPPDGRDPMKAEEHISAVAMSDELRSRLKKKKSLSQVDVEVQPVGNSWKIRGLSQSQQQ